MSLSPVQRIHMLKPPFKCQHKYFVCEELLFRENATGIWEGDLNSLNQIVQSIEICCLFSIKGAWLWSWLFSLWMIISITPYLQGMVPKDFLNLLKSISRYHQWNEYSDYSDFLISWKKTYIAFNISGTGKQMKLQQWHGVCSGLESSTY